MHKNFLLLSFSAQSAFGRVEISINDVFVNSSCGLHHHRAFILNSVNYSVSARNSHLSLAGYETDIVEPESTKFTRNLALTTRAIYTDGGKVATTYGKLSHDLVSLTRVLPVGKCCSYARRKNTQYSTMYMHISCCKMYKYLSHRYDDIMQREKNRFRCRYQDRSETTQEFGRIDLDGGRYHRTSQEETVSDADSSYRIGSFASQTGTGSHLHNGVGAEQLLRQISLPQTGVENRVHPSRYILYIYIYIKNTTQQHVLAYYVLEIAFFETDRYVHRFIY